jgi:hypothetical protein
MGRVATPADQPLPQLSRLAMFNLEQIFWARVVGNFISARCPREQVRSGMLLLVALSVAVSWHVGLSVCHGFYHAHS